MYRLYNGAPCSKLKALWDNQDRLLRELKKLLPTAGHCYYPMEGKHMCWDNHSYTPIVDKMFDSKEAALEAAIAELKEKK